jgi:WD40 repeat protein
VPPLRGGDPLKRVTTNEEEDSRGDAMFVWQAHEGAVTSLAFAPGAGLLTTGIDGNVRLWDAASGALQRGWKFHESAGRYGNNAEIVRVLGSSNGRFAAVALYTRGVHFFDLANGALAAEFPLAGVLGMVPAPDGKSVFVVGREEGRGRTLRRDSLVYQHAYPPGGVIAQSQSEVESGALAVSPDGKQVRAGGVRFSWPDGKRLDPVVIHAGGRQLAVSWDGDKLFGPSGSRLLVTGFHFGTFRKRLKGHNGQVVALASTPDGRKIWTAATDATVRQWDAETYRCEKCYGLKIGPLACVAVSPDGLTAAAGSSYHGTVAMWDLE